MSQWPCVSSYGLTSTTGSKAYVMGDERPQLRAAITCAATLSQTANEARSLEVTKRPHPNFACVSVCVCVCLSVRLSVRLSSISS